MNQKIEIENRNQQMNWGIEMENRNYKSNLDFVSAFWVGIGFGFLILALIIGIFSYGVRFEINFGKADSKNKIKKSGRLPGDDVEASGFAGNWKLNLF